MEPERTDCVKRKNLSYSNVIAAVDTREQWPLDLSPLMSVKKTLKTGDYSVVGLEDLISIERKSLDDFIQCCTVSRERFEKELERLREYPYRAIVIESSWAQIEYGLYRSKIRPISVLGSAMGFALSSNVSIIMATNHSSAGLLVARLLWVSAKRIYHSS